jgi:putative hydrolase of the HAD superfamily
MIPKNYSLFPSDFQDTKPNTIKALFFDLDDTLWPISPVINYAEKILFSWLREFAPTITNQFTIEDMRQHRLDLTIKNPTFKFDLLSLHQTALVSLFDRVGENKKKIDKAMKVFFEARNTVTLFEDVHPVLSRLSKHMMLGTISNGCANLETIGLAKYFQKSVAAYKLGYAKPEKAIFHEACTSVGVEPQETLYIGDDPFLDVIGAQKAGLKAVWINRFNRILPTGVNAQAECKDLFELESWLLTLST